MRRPVRSVGLTIVLAVAGAACGTDDGLSLADYATRAETALMEMHAKIEAGDERYAKLQTVTVNDVRVRWAERVDARTELLELLATLEPPEEAADLHAAAGEAITALIDAEQAIADLAGTASNIEQLAGIEEGELGKAFRAADDRAIALCEAAEEALNSEYEPGLVTSTPWVPMELQDVVSVGFGCTAEDRQSGLGG